MTLSTPGTRVPVQLAMVGNWATLKLNPWGKKSKLISLLAHRSFPPLCIGWAGGTETVESVSMYIFDLFWKSPQPNSFQWIKPFSVISLIFSATLLPSSEDINTSIPSLKQFYQASGLCIVEGSPGDQRGRPRSKRTPPAWQPESRGASPPYYCRLSYLCVDKRDVDPSVANQHSIHVGHVVHLQEDICNIGKYKRC